MNSKESAVYRALLKVADGVGFHVVEHPDRASYWAAMRDLTAYRQHREMLAFSGVDMDAMADMLTADTSGVTTPSLRRIDIGPNGQRVEVLAHEICHAMNEYASDGYADRGKSDYAEARAFAVGGAVADYFGCPHPISTKCLGRIPPHSPAWRGAHSASTGRTAGRIIREVERYVTVVGRRAA